jgi:tetratricopeptide (TPR) repeat protein
LLGVGLLLLIGAGVGGFLWWNQEQLPQPGSERYEEYVVAFEKGTAALDTGVPEIAEANLTRAIDLVLQEPAGWANRGLLYIRTQRIPQAERDVGEAHRLAPDDPTIEKLLGLIAQGQGKYGAAAEHFRRAAELDPDDVEALFRLAEAVKADRPADSDAEYQQLMERILALRPDNVRVLLERLRVALRRGDRAAVDDTLARFRKLAPDFEDRPNPDNRTLTQLDTLQKKLAADLDPQAIELDIFTNVLKGEPLYRRSQAEIDPENQFAGTPLRNFLRLAPVRNTPSPPDTGVTFTAEPLADAPPGRWDHAEPVWMTGEGNPVVFVANGQGVRAVASATVIPTRMPLTTLLGIDWNNDTRTDLLAVGPAGVRFFEQDAKGAFAEVTAKTKLPADVLNGNYAAALAADVDLDGDIDIVLAPQAGPPVVLRNNSEGTFLAQKPFAGVDAPRAFAWADFDADGAPDLAALDARGHLHVFANERSGKFRPWPAAVPRVPFVALAVADANDDGVLDLVALRRDGAVMRFSDRDKRTRWENGVLGNTNPIAGEPGTMRMFAADLDNNGVPDLVASGASASAAWLGSGGGKFDPLPARLPPRVTAVADLAVTGRLDLLALDADGRPVRFRNAGTRNYHWQTVRFRAMPIADRKGDDRINSFGIGGEIEVRTGTLTVKQPVAAPVVHFGLGDRTRADVLRITWPNGGSQFEFDFPVDTTVSAQQRLKGSCPFLFTWDGERFAFVADFMWSSPLGMYINAQNAGGLGGQAAEWVRVRGDQLVPRDGHYEVRVNANLWETHFFDHLALHVVDHPPGTELYCDERFALEPFAPNFQLMEQTRPVAKATDHLGGDATEVVRAVDGVYLDRCGRGKYQGITNDHWVEVDLGDDAPTTGPVWLVAHGWIHPTDSSINFAIEQGEHVKPRGLSLEVPDGSGGWKPVRTGIGFPAGKNKTALIRLDGVNGPGVARRFRLRTNMEIFWDALHYARGSAAEGRKTELLPVAADLRFRGILEMTQANPSSPELPHYDRLASHGQPWRDLIGFHTRYGDIRELVERVDDRYAIVNAGDDIALRFAVPPGPPPGWVRDFVWVSDGWEKDGDLNTRFGKTVLPLPYHGMPRYDVPPGRLEDDPVFRRHRKDWDVFHTRYVTPSVFERGLRPRR